MENDKMEEEKNEVRLPRWSIPILIVLSAMVLCNVFVIIKPDSNILYLVGALLGLAILFTIYCVKYRFRTNTDIITELTVYCLKQQDLVDKSIKILDNLHTRITRVEDNIDRITKIIEAVATKE